MLRRAFSLLTVTWLAIAIAEPMALHICEMHGNGAAHHGAAPTLPAPSAPDEQDHGDRHVAGHGTAVPDEPPATHACTCLGDCCAVALASVPAAGQATFAPASVRREVAFPALRTARVATAGLRLPFATAPPVLPAVLSLS